MKKHVSLRGSESGMALLTATIFVAVSLLVLGMVATRHLQQRNQAEFYQTYQTTFDGAESALLNSKLSVENGDSGIVGLDDWDPVYNDDNTLVLPDFDSTDADPASFASLEQMQYMSYAVDWFTDGRDSNGDGAVDNEAERDMVSLHTAAEFNNVDRRLEAVYRTMDVNVWRNAIFAGNGQAGGLINGNVSIHGSVHLLGNNIMNGNPAIEALDLSGTSLIHNNYEGIPASLRARVPALPTTLHKGATVEYLRAKLRVRRGLVGMSGNSEIGQPYVAGATVKDTMDGVFVNDGWSGNQVIDNGGRGIPKNVYSDNSHTALYDLGNRVAMPMLSDDWRNVDGTRILNPDTNDWYTHEDYFSMVLLADPAVKNDGVYNGNITLDTSSKTKFYWNATKNTTNVAILPAATDDYILFDPANNTLKMNGQIRINGTLTFAQKGSDKVINYSGRAAFLVRDNVTIDADLVSCNNGNPASTANSFPVNNIIGLMTYKDMMVGSTSQLQIMGAFYAQGTIKTMKQTNVMGTFVANYFDMGSQVPSIFQVPTLADNLPLGMIANYPLLTLELESWRELDLI